MTTEIYVISGFLGAGKTTLIQKLLKEAFQKEKVILIENDFGEISVDAALLKSGSVEVTEITSGCICCSLSGDFVKALREVLDRFHPDKILIEPSGVSKLSDIIKACSDPRIQSLAKVKRKITVADVKRCKMYLDNFGEFFEDQIKNADVILLSRTEAFPDRVSSAQNLIRSLNQHSAIVAKPWDRINAAELIYPAEHSGIHTVHFSHGSRCRQHGAHDHDGCKHDHDNGREHDHNDGCRHDHNDSRGHDHNDGCRYDHNGSREHDHNDGCRHDHDDSRGHDHNDGCRYDHNGSREHDRNNGCKHDHNDGYRYDHNDGYRYDHNDSRGHDRNNGYMHDHNDVCRHDRNSSYRHEHNGCGHNHSAEDVFDTVTIRTKQIFGTEDLKARVSAMEQNGGGTILRAKGIVRGTTGYINLQYLPGDIQITKCTVAGDMLCIIGQDLNRQELCTLFGGE